MSLASVILTWQDGSRIYSRLTTNVGRGRLLARLKALGMLESVDTIHAFFADRAVGGSGYELLWKENVRWDELGKLLIKL